ncbi:MAG: UPF0175 family protein [Nanoarchaeota archaeon]|nr:UPF0175 family protein [Nanoarchaeota archaeon]
MEETIDLGHLIEEGKKMKALNLYKNKRISLGLAAKLAGMTLSDFLDLLEEHNVKLNLTLLSEKSPFVRWEMKVKGLYTSLSTLNLTGCLRNLGLCKAVPTILLSCSAIGCAKGLFGDGRKKPLAKAGSSSPLDDAKMAMKNAEELF